MTKIAKILLVAVIVCLPCGASAQQYFLDANKEFTAITATAATTDQESATIDKPVGAIGILFYIDVTAGTTLLLDLNVNFYREVAAGWVILTSNLPSAEGITGISTSTNFMLSPYNVTMANVTDSLMVLPNRIQFWVDHGNANEATYTVNYQWLWGG